MNTYFDTYFQVSTYKCISFFKIVYANVVIKTVTPYLYGAFQSKVLKGTKCMSCKPKCLISYLVTYQATLPILQQH